MSFGLIFIHKCRIFVNLQPHRRNCRRGWQANAMSDRIETNVDENMNIIGKNVLITGGASGIGRIMGRICLEKGAANLIIWDINRANIDITEAELGYVRPKVKAAAQGHISSYIVNVASPEEIALTYEKSRKKSVRWISL